MQQRRVQLCACRHALQLGAMTAHAEARFMRWRPPSLRPGSNSGSSATAVPHQCSTCPYLPASCRSATSWCRTRRPWQSLATAAAPCSCSQRFGCAATAAAGFCRWGHRGHNLFPYVAAQARSPTCRLAAAPLPMLLLSILLCRPLMHGRGRCCEISCATHPRRCRATLASWR